MKRGAWVVIGLVFVEAVFIHSLMKQARAEEAPVTKCDTYAASETDPQHKTKGVPYDKINSALAIPACEDAVRQYHNSSRLIFELGRAYDQNNDFTSALVQYRKAANQGYEVAQHNLGVMYERAQGVTKDDVQAIAWYRKAAEQGYVPSQFNLGNMYANGQGVPQNYDEAVKWIRLAADQGYAVAQNKLGTMYAKGQGVTQDDNEALKWIRLAANQGDAAGQHNLAVLSKIGNSPTIASIDPHSSSDDHNSYYCRSLRLDYPYTKTCPEPWVTVKSLQIGDYNPLISCGSAGCFPTDDTDASRGAAAQANAENARAADAINAHAERKITDGSMPTLVIVVGALSLFLTVYFFPTLVAHSRHNHNTGAILVLNLFLGWTLLGWVLALVWAFTRPAPSAREGN